MKSTNWILGVVGLVIGGAAGFFAFFWLVRQGFYAMVLPGALLGLGCGLLSRAKSELLGIICGLAALLLGLFIEWRFAPFAADDSLAYFIAHVHQLKGMTLLLIAVGGILAYWLGKGRPRRERA